MSTDSIMASSLLPVLKPLPPPGQQERSIPFHLTFADYQARLPPLGLLRPDVVEALQDDAAAHEQALLDCHTTPAGEGQLHAGITDRNGDTGVGVIWQFFMSAFPVSFIPAAETEADCTDGEGEDVALELDEVLQTRVECVFLSGWASKGGSARITEVVQQTVRG